MGKCWETNKRQASNFRQCWIWPENWEMERLLKKSRKSCRTSDQRARDKLEMLRALRLPMRHGGTMKKCVEHVGRLFTCTLLLLLAAPALLWGQATECCNSP